MIGTDLSGALSRTVLLPNASVSARETPDPFMGAVRSDNRCGDATLKREDSSLLGQNTSMTNRAIRFGGFVMTFDRPEILRQTILAVLEQTRAPDYLLVVDNGTNPQTEKVVRAFPKALVGYYNMGSNTGPAGAAAFGLEQLAKDGFDWIWWGDDDDPPQTGDTFETLLRLAVSQGPDTGVVAAVGNYWDSRRGRVRRPADSELDGILSLDVFGGGTHPIFSRRTVDRVGVPDASLFFSFEDLEYSLRIRQAGLQILADGDLYRRYRTLAGRMNLAPQRKLLRPQPVGAVWRQYYDTRNYIYIAQRVLGRNDLAAREAGRATARAMLSWRHGLREGFAVSVFQMRGVLDGLRGRMGSRVTPVAKYPASGPT